MKLLKKKLISCIITMCMVAGVLFNPAVVSAESGGTGMLVDIGSKYTFTFRPGDLQVAYFSTGDAGSYKVWDRGYRKKQSC
ncbi:hypothetical protein [Anaerocolumna xylanovorans]|uniref:Uncharacterized protein n=1 Tax=Anaerocolumna xylanovorans DSM 12503 TaxID=1121345 RepID=A0A1M7YGJ7_9FIRM|nr:hypothetical protein [Anaerocolumna xylanovorans]SHO51740.1 hypothetical protein SAMN02745217_03304 [Anaerocolumna xylanovorans DSM 12503]